MYLVWSPELATGNRQIDDQHIRLFQLFNDLLEAIEQSGGQEVVSRTLTALSVYVVAHFRMEEELMRHYGYAGLAAHHEAHETMRIQVEDMVDQYTLIGIEPTQVMRVLKQWLIGHVQNEDMAMAQFLLAAQREAGTD
jgi:hemerythrin-like metal-binding protein